MILQSHPSGADAWFVVATPTSLLALPATEARRVSELTSRLGGDDGFRAALESLVGAGIASAPSFALLDGDGAVLRVVLRGDAAVAANVSGADVTFSGAGMATWTERVLEQAGSLQLTVPGSTWTVLLAVGSAEIVVTPAENTLVPHAEAEVVSAAVPVSPVPVPVPVQTHAHADADSEPYDFLFGDTIYRTQAGAAIRIPNPDPEQPGDHDGQTMLAEDLGLAGRMPATREVVVSAVSEATVLAPIPSRAAPVTELAATTAAAQAPSLPLGATLQLERADGSRESLSRAVLIGRSPAASPAAPGHEPRLLAIPDDPDISRTHLRVAVEGDAVVVTDLGSKNGTLITLPGASPRKLRASEPTVVLPGTLIDLGGGTAFTVRED
ncbi:MAG: FHA domain-containing protein [Pseudolysinimonas sp.]